MTPAPAEYRAAPAAVVVMGVAGSGKSTIAAALAARLGWVYADGDSFHPPANVAKMTAGQPLDDTDREPWLRAIAAWIDERATAGETGVVACSALKRAYRDILRSATGPVRIVYLAGQGGLIKDRMARRAGHFMPTSLLESQFRTLEPPTPDEHAITVDIAGAPEAIVAQIVRGLGLES
jgi:gluconokinase